MDWDDVDPIKKKPVKKDLTRLSIGDLKEYIEENERQLLSLNTSASDFEDPNWSHKQAFRNGQLSGLKKMKELIPF